MATNKQKKLLKKISENLGNQASKPIGTMMREVGYSESTSKTPSRVTQSKGFVELLEKAGISDSKIAKRLNEGLDALKYAGKLELPDMYARHRYLITALELKGHIKKEGIAQEAKVINVVYGHKIKPKDSTNSG